jgi:hypothetical protein
MLGTDADDGLNLVPGARQDHGGRHSTESGKAIAFVGLELISLHDNSFLTDHRAKLCKHSLGEFRFDFRYIWGSAQHSRPRMLTSVNLCKFGSGICDLSLSYSAMVTLKCSVKIARGKSS